jgi:hypothetical protein
LRLETISLVGPSAVRVMGRKTVAGEKRLPVGRRLPVKNGCR